MKKVPLIQLISAIIIAELLFIGCGGGGGGDAPPPKSNSEVSVSWTANRETAVNTLGGGYRVYYSTTPGFNIIDGTVVDVPYKAGVLAPNSTVISLPSGNYYFKVVAYSSLNSNGSESSQERSIAVP